MRQQLLLLPLTLVALMLAPNARAAGPTARECVAANEASLKLSGDKRLRAAREQLLVCAASTCPKVVKAECTRQIEETNALLPTVLFVVKNASGQDVTAVKISMDGEVVASTLDGTEITLDPGSHTLTFEVAGEPTITRTFIFRERDKGRRETLVVGPPPPTSVVVPGVAEPALAVAHDGGAHAQKTVGMVTVGIGAAGLIVGGILGGLAVSTWSTAKGACAAEQGCSATAVNDSKTASTYATGSTIAFIAGGVVAAAGVTIFVLAPKSEAPTVGVRVSPGGVLLAGAF